MSLVLAQIAMGTVAAYWSEFNKMRRDSKPYHVESCNSYRGFTWQVCRKKASELQ